MENKMRFRNHFSVLLEQIGKVGWAILVALFMGVGEALGEEEMTSDVTVDLETVAILAFVGTVILGGILLRVLIWSKTWITIEENAITIECNTILRQKKNTIGIKNISNINLEQNLIERIFGTSKLKFDTNSLSTANSTDVQLVLKKDFAEEVQKKLLARMRQLEKGEEMPEIVNEVENAQPKVAPYLKASTSDIIRHGFMSAGIMGSAISIIVLVALIVSVFAAAVAESEEVLSAGLFTIIWLAVLVISYVWKYVQNFIRYLDFTIAREDDRLMLSYGVIKKVNYSIPVDKIQALKFKQTGLGRLLKSGMVEVINVGMNDGEAQEQCFLLPYYKKDKVEHILKALLPEFADCLQLKEERQPKSIWFVWLWAIFVYLLVMAIGVGVVAEFIPEALVYVGVAVAVLSILLLLWKWGTYLTKGSHFEGNYLMLVSGCMGKESVFVKYDKIQHVTIKQSFLAKKCNVVKGYVFLLASSVNQTHKMPYFRQEKLETLREKLY